MKILIVDDERFVVEGLTRLISENVSDVEIVSADNGESVLLLCDADETPPALLITDVSMPRMDGITLSQAIRERYPDCRIMIISGYADFQAARSAIEFGALRYMLKPIRHEEMVEYVRSVIDEVQREQQAHLQAVIQHRKNLLTALHNHWLQDIPFHGEERIAEETGEYCIVKLVSIGAGVPTDAKPPLLLEDALASAIAQRDAPAFTVQASAIQATLLLCDFSPADIAWLERLSMELESMLCLPHAVGVGCCRKSLEDLYLSYRTAGLAVWRAYLSGAGTTVFDDATMRENTDDLGESLLGAVFRLREDVRRMLDFYTLVPDKQQLQYAIYTFLSRLERIGCPLSMQQLMCAELAAELLGSNYLPGLTQDADFEQYLCLPLYAGCQSFEQLHKVMTQFIQLYTQMLDQINRSGGSRLVLHIRSAIHADLRNASLSQVADTLNMSPSYISMVFKEKTGQNFKDYLFTTRMNHAKRLLRQEISVQEIAQRLGYEDAEHFSRRFREHFGVSPTIYRRDAKTTSEE